MGNDSWYRIEYYDGDLCKIVVYSVHSTRQTMKQLQEVSDSIEKNVWTVMDPDPIDFAEPMVRKNNLEKLISEYLLGLDDEESGRAYSSHRALAGSELSMFAEWLKKRPEGEKDD